MAAVVVAIVRPGARQPRTQLVRLGHGHRDRGDSRSHIAGAYPRSARIRPHGLGVRHRPARRAHRGGGGALAAPPDRRPQPRIQPTDGPLLRGRADGAAYGGCRRAAGRQGPDRGTSGRRPGLGVVGRGHRRRAVHRDDHSLPDVHAVQRRTGRGVRRLVDASGSTDGLRGYGRVADPAHGAGHRPGNHAVRVLCDVRAVLRRRDDHHHHGVEPSRALRHIRHRARSDAVDRAGPARSIDNGRGPTRNRRGPGGRTRSGRRHDRLRHPFRSSRSRTRPSRCPVLPSGRGVRRQHGAIPCIELLLGAVTPA